jgi:hypothetical protein
VWYACGRRVMAMEFEFINVKGRYHFGDLFLQERIISKWILDNRL